MKLVKSQISKDGVGFVSLIPDHFEDIWQLYNLILVNDYLEASTYRKVTNESATGSTKSTRHRTTVTIKVESIEYDAGGGKLRLNGRCATENAYIQIGQYHSLEVELNKKIRLTKKFWDSVTQDRVNACTNIGNTADLAAIVMQEGLANVCLVTSSMTVVKSKIDIAIPRKRKNDVSQHEKGMIKFFDTIIQAVLRHIDFNVVKSIIVASPGFTKDRFFEYAKQFATKTDNKILQQNFSKFVLAHSSNGFKSALKEVLQDPNIKAKLTDVKAIDEVKALESFYKMLQSNPLRACYGEKHVFLANESEAIEVLLISDTLFRSHDFEKRAKYVKLVENVKQLGGNVKIFSSQHVSGEQLDQLTGLCAELRFPMEELDDDTDSDSDSDDSDSDKEPTNLYNNDLKENLQEEFESCFKRNSDLEDDNDNE